MPPVTLTLIIANVALFMLELSGGGGLVESFALWPDSNFQPWQLLTYSFLHGSVSHIFFNMLGLYMFGSEVERLFGARFYLGYYLATAVASPLTLLSVTALMGAPPAAMVVACAGVYGLH